MDRRRFMLKRGRLPNLYQEVEYIESHDGAYIDTGLYVDGLTTHLTFQYVGECVNGATVAGCWNWGSRYQICRAASDGFYYDVESMQQLKYNTAYDNDVHTINFYTANEHAIYFDGSVKGGSYDDIIYSEIAKLFLFASRGQNGAEYFANARISDAYMVKNNQRVREYVPCVNVYTHEAGLFDLIGNKFYGNKGNGYFTAGGAV